MFFRFCVSGFLLNSCFIAGSDSINVSGCVCNDLDFTGFYRIS